MNWATSFCIVGSIWGVSFAGLMFLMVRECVKESNTTNEKE